jgi:hypothetical protein
MGAIPLTGQRVSFQADSRGFREGEYRIEGAPVLIDDAQDGAALHIHETGTFYTNVNQTALFYRFRKSKTLQTSLFTG